MKKAILGLIAIILTINIPTMAKSSKTDIEMFRENIERTAPVGKDGHIPYRSTKPSAFPWQSGTGVKKVLVLLIEFPDVKSKQGRSRIEDFFVSDKTDSVKGYYNTASEGKLIFDPGSHGIPDWLTLEKKYIDYIKENDRDYYSTCDAVASAGLQMAIKKGLDVSEYDSDKNGLPDITIYFFAGDSRRIGGIMPGAFCGSTAEGTFIMVSEDLSSRSNNTPSLIHELGHGLIPLWDLYDYSYSSDPYQDWDIMDGSSEGKSGLSAFSRWKAGWIDVQWLDKPGTYEIDNLNGSGANKAYGINIPGSDREWLLIENRQKAGIDNIFTGCPGEGIVTYLVDDKRPYAHGFNTLYFDGHETHGIIFLKLLKDGSPLNSDTTPSALPYKKLDRLTPNISISNVSKSGEKMTFTLAFDRPKLPIAGVNNRFFLGKIVKNTKKTFDIPFTNVGSGTLYIIMSTRNDWLTLDRKSFIGNQEIVQGTVNTEGMQRGKTSGTIFFVNKSSETNGFISVEFEVAPIHGDIITDEKVDQLDFEEFMKYYGMKGDDPGFKPEADFNSDASIDFKDLCLLAKNFHPTVK